ncbi:hypothetical protein CAOG_04027 [Capsaspora owczarzaki ATCC 30864]|uniref:hypothetical protein n=1 Tax=Capsaspora owczarzaki (strain ATCC 30864) TaxID=595528 RepID=UPI0001FE40A1|nr:hypothetical protein CAOG_04027 [Capsaspora owczarzaki ATCC 30864]|eukprot:XP_004347852.1 hypothetical protein CAOG_04027 [Capsaspora owczarzaki ATCC 30864]
MLSYQRMTGKQRKLYRQVKNEEITIDKVADKLDVAEAQVIAAALKVHATIEDVQLDQNQIGDTGLQAIAEALTVNTTVTHLGLQLNQIGDAGAQALAEALKVSKTLIWLDLNKNQIGDVGAGAIAEALKVNTTTLTELFLGWNQIGDAGAQAIAEALRVTTTLTFLDLRRNQIGDAGAQAIAEALKVNTTTLTELFMSANQIGDTGAQAIAEALKIGDVGAQAFAKVAQVRPMMTCIDLQGNYIGDAGTRAIEEARFANESSAIDFDNQISPLAFSLQPRSSTTTDIQTVFHLLTRGPFLPALPAEIADRVLDEACYWQGVRYIKRPSHDGQALEVRVPWSIDGNSIQVKAIQALRYRSNRTDTDNIVFDLIVRDEHCAVRYKCAAKPTFVESTVECATIERASHGILREMREGWTVQLMPGAQPGVVIESLYIGFV